MSKPWKVRKAEAVLAKHKKKEEIRKEDRKKEREEMQAKRDAHHDLIDEFTKRYVGELVAAFTNSVKPEFGKGEQVVLNWYAPGNSWEGNIRSNLSHVDEKLGPIYVTISKPHVDEAYIYEEIQQKMDSDMGKFNHLFSEGHYGKFVEIVDKWRMCHNPSVSWVGYSYNFKALDDKIKLPTYSLRETNFLKIGNAEERTIRELWGMECEKDKLQKQIEANRILVKSFQEKAEALASISAKFYVGIF